MRQNAEKSPPKLSPGAVQILVGHVNAPENVLDAQLAGANVVQVATPGRGLWVTFTEGGVAIATPRRAGALTWGQLAAFAETGELSARAYGLVCDGTFRAWYPSRAQAEHMAADLRASYGRVELVELDPDLAAKLAK